MQAAVVKGVSACVRGDRAARWRAADNAASDEGFEERAALKELVGAGTSARARAMVVS